MLTCTSNWLRLYMLRVSLTLLYQHAPVPSHPPKTKPNPCFNKLHKLWCGQVYPKSKQQTDKVSATRRAVTVWLLCNLDESVSALLSFSFIVLNKASDLSILTRTGQKTPKDNYAVLEGTGDGRSRPLTRNCYILVSSMEKEKNQED